jgi:hypothetical protein
MYFPFRLDQQDLFIRTDIGLLRRMVAGDPHFEPEYTWGFSSLGSLGYAIPIGKQQTLQLDIRYMPMLIKKQYESNIGLNLGIMF